MAKKLYEEENIKAIANALRGKCGTTCGYKVCDMAAAIETIQADGGDYDITVTENTDGTQSFAIVDAGLGEPTKLITKTITANGTYAAKDDEADGYISVTVDVESGFSAPVVDSISITENGTYTPPDGVDGYNPITVDVDPKLATLAVTANGTYYPPTGTDGYNSVIVSVAAEVVGPSGTLTIKDNGTHNVFNYAEAVVDVQPPLQNKTVTTEGVYTADEGYYGLGSVTVDTPFVIPEIGFFISEYNTDGLISKGIWYGAKVPDSACYYWQSLTDVEFNDEATEIGKNAFGYTDLSGLTELPDTITTIGQGAFIYSKISLTKLPDSLTTLGNTSFSNSKIAIQEIPAGVTAIPNACFQKCTNITSMTLPAGLSTMEYNAFMNCSGLTTVTFKGTPTSINSGAFNSCTNLRTINVPWASGAVAGAPWGATSATINYNYTV